jgi:hypothetical protein
VGFLDIHPKLRFLSSLPILSSSICGSSNRSDNYLINYFSFLIAQVLPGFFFFLSCVPATTKLRRESVVSVGAHLGRLIGREHDIVKRTAF